MYAVTHQAVKRGKREIEVGNCFVDVPFTLRNIGKCTNLEILESSIANSKITLILNNSNYINISYY